MMISMRLFLISIFILSFGAISLLSAFSMHHMDAQGHSSCLAALSRGMSCFEANNPFAVANSHIEAFKGFSRATIGGGIVFLLIGLLLAAAINSRRLSDHEYLSNILPSYFKEFFEVRGFPRDLILVKWLSLHENSPSLA